MANAVDVRTLRPTPDATHSEGEVQSVPKNERKDFDALVERLLTENAESLSELASR